GRGWRKKKCEIKHSLSRWERVPEGRVRLDSSKSSVPLNSTSKISTLRFHLDVLWRLPESRVWASRLLYMKFSTRGSPKSWIALRTLPANLSPSRASRTWIRSLWWTNPRLAEHPDQTRPPTQGPMPSSVIFSLSCRKPNAVDINRDGSPSM